jgi:SAM-dependent methyltransferase
VRLSSLALPVLRSGHARIAAVNAGDADYRHIEQTYDEGSSDYTRHFPKPHEFIEHERRQFIERLPAGATILDCGCRPGFDTERFTQRGFNVTAIDLSDRFVKLTERRVPNAVVRKMDMRSLELPKGSFDGLWASFSLLHIRASDIDRTLSGFRSVLKHSGMLCAALHRGAKTAWVKNTISGMERDTYLQEWVQEEIEERFRQSGFDILASRAFTRTGGRYPLMSILAMA